MESEGNLVFPINVDKTCFCGKKSREKMYLVMKFKNATLRIKLIPIQAFNTNFVQYN